MSTSSAVVHRMKRQSEDWSWYTAEFWSTTPVVLCVVGTTSTSVTARSTPQDMPLSLRLALRSPLTCRQQVNLAEGPFTSTFGTQIMTRVPVTTTYVMTFAPGKSVADLQIESVREAFALQCGVSTAAVTFEYDIEAVASNYKHEAHVKIFLESSDATDVLCRIIQCLC